MFKDACGPQSSLVTLESKRELHAISGIEDILKLPAYHSYSLEPELIRTSAFSNHKLMVGAVESFIWNLFTWTDTEAETQLSEPAMLFDLTRDLVGHAFSEQIFPTPIRKISATTKLNKLVCDMGDGELCRI